MKRLFGPYPPAPQTDPETPPPPPESAAPAPKAPPPPRRRSGAFTMVTRAHRERLARISAAAANYRSEQQEK